MKCFLSQARVEGKISNAAMKNKLQMELFTKQKGGVEGGQMSQINVWGFHQTRTVGLEHEKNKIPPEEEVDLEARDKVSAADTAGTTTGASRNASQEESTCQLRPRTETRLVGRPTFEPFLGLLCGVGEYPRQDFGSLRCLYCKTQLLFVYL